MRRPVIHEGEMQIYFGKASNTPRGVHEICMACDPAIKREANALFLSLLLPLQSADQMGFDITTIRFRIQRKENAPKERK